MVNGNPTSSVAASLAKHDGNKDTVLGAPSDNHTLFHIENMLPLSINRD